MTPALGLCCAAALVAAASFSQPPADSEARSTARFRSLCTSAERVAEAKSQIEVERRYVLFEGRRYRASLWLAPGHETWTLIVQLNETDCFSIPGAKLHLGG